jgi:hypothetical protein
MTKGLRCSVNASLDAIAEETIALQNMMTKRLR